VSKITSIAGSYGWMENFEITAVEVKDRNSKFTWKIVGTCRAPNEDM